MDNICCVLKVLSESQPLILLSSANYRLSHLIYYCITFYHSAAGVPHRPERPAPLPAEP